jgi:hypothetical protein
VNARCELFSIFTSNLIVGKKFTLDLYQINKEIFFSCTNDLRRRRDININVIARDACTIGHSTRRVSHIDQSGYMKRNKQAVPYHTICFIL